MVRIKQKPHKLSIVNIEPKTCQDTPPPAPFCKAPRMQLAPKKTRPYYVQTGGVKKPYRFKYSTIAIRMIRKYQKSTQLLIPKLCFQGIVREITASFSRHGVRFYWTRLAMLALQEATEAKIVKLFDQAQRLAIHAGRETINDVDIRLALRIGGDRSLHPNK